MINSMGSCFNALSVSSLPLIVVLLFLTAGLQNGPNHIAALISQEEWDIHNVAKRMDIELCVGEKYFQRFFVFGLFKF